MLLSYHTLPHHVVTCHIAPCLTLRDLRALRCIDTCCAANDSAVSQAIQTRHAGASMLYAAVNKLHAFWSRSVAIHYAGLVNSSVQFIREPPKESMRLSLTDVVALERLRTDAYYSAPMLREMSAWDVLLYQQTDGRVLTLTVVSIIRQLYGKRGTLHVIIGRYAHPLWLYALNHEQKMCLPRQIACPMTDNVVNTSSTTTTAAVTTTTTSPTATLITKRVDAFSWGYYVRMTSCGIYSPNFEQTPSLVAAVDAYAAASLQTGIWQDQ